MIGSGEDVNDHSSAGIGDFCSPFLAFSARWGISHCFGLTVEMAPRELGKEDGGMHSSLYFMQRHHLSALADLLRF